MQAKNNSPQLRFSNFTSDWQVKKLGDLVDIFDGTHQTPTYVADGVPFYSVEHVTANNFQSTKYISESVFQKEKRRPQKGDLLMTRIGDIGTIKYLDWDVRASFYVSLALIKQSESVNNKFLSHLMHTSGFQSELWKRTIHVAFPKKINLGEISSCVLKIPSDLEQEKIADFLTIVDKRIVVSEKKLELLQKYKKGVMQKIFTRAVQFKDENGSPYPEWEEKRLGEIGETYAGLTGKSGADFGSGANYVTYMQIFSDSKIDVTKFSQVRIAPNERQNKVQQGDIFFTTSSETPQEVGYTSVLLDQVDDVYLNSFCFGYRVNKAILSTEFARYLFHCQAIRIAISRLAQGSTRFNLSKNELMKMVVALPSLEEQQKIAIFFTVLDDKIKAEQARLTAAKQWKKGLLQRMFV